MYVLFIKTLYYLLIHIIVSSKFFGNPELIFSFHIVGNKEELKTKLKDIPVRNLMRLILSKQRKIRLDPKGLISSLL